MIAGRDGAVPTLYNYTKGHAARAGPARESSDDDVQMHRGHGPLLQEMQLFETAFHVPSGHPETMKRGNVFVGAGLARELPDDNVEIHRGHGPLLQETELFVTAF